MSKLGTIRIKGVRGIRSELTLDLEGRSLLLRGDNGTGKSSIAQALRWCLLGQISSANAGAIPPEFQRHLLEKDAAASEIDIALHGGGRIVMKGGAIDAALTDATGHAYLACCKRSSPFLRRDELLAFLSDEAKDRFKYIERFLELDAVDTLLSKISPLAKDEEAKASEAQESLGRMIDEASKALPQAAVSTVTQLLASLYAEAARLGIAVVTDGTFDGLDALREKLPRTKPDPTAAQRRAQLSSALERANALAPPEHPHTALTGLRDAEARAAETDLAPLLMAAAAAFERHPHRETCPVCEQSVVAANLGPRLRSRLALLEEVHNTTESALALGGAWAEFYRRLDELEAVVKASPPEVTTRATGRALLDELVVADADGLSGRTLARLAELRETLTTARDAIPDELRASELAKLAQTVDTARQLRADLETAEKDARSHEKRAKDLRTVEKAISSARKDVVDATTKDIESLVADFYQRVHPPDRSEEVTGAPKIRVKRYGAGTAHVVGSINETEIGDPLNVYSDGHLDTVGICVFLALRKRSSTGPKLLVLDDIVLSIDNGHAERLVELLREDFRDHQTLILSHNELFMRMCRKPFSQAKYLEIVRWTLENGPLISGHVSNVEELEDKLATSGSAERVASTMRPVLDALLLDACGAFEVKLPLTRGRGLTVDEYWSPLRLKLHELVKAGLVPNLDATFEKIGSPSFFRNALGAHLNEWALEAQLKQVQRVAEGILAIVAALTCTGCKRIPSLRNSRDPREGFRCDCPRSAGGPSLPHHLTESETDR